MIDPSTSWSPTFCSPAIKPASAAQATLLLFTLPTHTSEVMAVKRKFDDASDDEEVRVSIPLLPTRSPWSNKS